MWAAFPFILSSIAIAQVHALALYPRQDASPAVSVNGVSLVTPSTTGSTSSGRPASTTITLRSAPPVVTFLSGTVAIRTVTITNVLPYPTAITLRSSYIPTIPSVIPTPGVGGSTPQESNTSTGLSNGAKIALGVTISAATVAFAALAFFIMRRLRERRAGSSAGVFRREKRAWGALEDHPTSKGQGGEVRGTMKEKEHDHKESLSNPAPADPFASELDASAPKRV
ncbi:hypothetical protein PLEOSDRAFT_1088010 [Pleurotus ostreatus PC15]|uniref:Mid2 domain-containing protein n=1 Tax=Pleurotus ostreatus (strain PC15) TaxID=1137138 RepID=A0A067PC67_PLEO1|nr:hypothetical protein PLEOSDRAFT_1088010 [Pleurotus ostreatus PC15]